MGNKSSISTQNPSTTTYYDRIKNCNLKFKCPLKWDNLTETDNKNICFCNKCNENVVHITNRKELDECV